MTRILVLIVILVALITGCGQSEQVAAPSSVGVDPMARAAILETTGCGVAAPRTGSGVAVDDGVVLTVAHLVARADTITATVGDHDPEPADVVAIDLRRDLALLRVPPNGLPPVGTALIAPTESGTIVGGSASGNLPFTVERAARMTTEEILGTETHVRSGYEVGVVTAMGDSGAGAFDRQNRLVGILFAMSDDTASSWITSADEISAFLSEHETGATPIVCDPSRSRLAVP